MAQLVLRNAAQDVYLAWAAPRVGLLDGVFPDNAQAMAVVDDETKAIKAVAVYVQTYAGVIDMHFASDGSRRWANRSILGGIFGYAFYFLGAQRLTNVARASDKSTLVMEIKLGWQIEARLRGAMDDGEDGILLSMLKDECDWIKDGDTHG